MTVLSMAVLQFIIYIISSYTKYTYTHRKRDYTVAKKQLQKVSEGTLFRKSVVMWLKREIGIEKEQICIDRS